MSSLIAECFREASSRKHSAMRDDIEDDICIMRPKRFLGRAKERLWQFWQFLAS